MTPSFDTGSDATTLQTALVTLCESFVDMSRLAWAWQEQRDLPEPCRSLLVHNDHMTTVLRRHHQCALTLEVLGELVVESMYSRMILLRTDIGQVAEFGIVQIDLSCLPAAAQAEVRARHAPLGDILIRHNLLRRVEPLSWLRFDPPGTITAYFGGTATAYGRLGVIHCNGQPAIQLLEVVPLLRVMTDEFE